MQHDLALEKLKRWCAFQERSQEDTRRKLYQLGLKGEPAEQVIAALVQDNFLNEARFAMAFAGGKFRIKRWGKQKIKVELRRHGVSDYCIQKALASLQEEDYEKQLKLLLTKKLALIKTTDRRKKYYTTLKYAVSKGYEAEAVTTLLNTLLEPNDDES